MVEERWTAQHSSKARLELYPVILNENGSAYALAVAGRLRPFGCFLSADGCLPDDPRRPSNVYSCYDVQEEIYSASALVLDMMACFGSE